MPKLTPAQRETIQLSAGGYNLRQIALIMGISYQMARNHMQAVHAAYRTRGSHTAAIVEGIRSGDVSLAAAYANVLAIKKSR